VPTLYVETNFIVGYAVGQRTNHDDILRAAAARALELRIPQVCVMEAYSAIDRITSEYNAFGSSIRSRVKQLRRSVSSAAAATAVKSLESASLDLASVDADVLTRRDHVLLALAKDAQFFSIDPRWFSDAGRRTLIDQPRDSLIADSIIRDAANRRGQAVYYTENTSDFDTLSVRAALLAVGVKFTDDPNVAVSYVEGHRTWPSISSS
jgi:hypothetical protein